MFRYLFSNLFSILFSNLFHFLFSILFRNINSVNCSYICSVIYSENHTIIRSKSGYQIIGSEKCREIYSIKKLVICSCLSLLNLVLKIKIFDFKKKLGRIIHISLVLNCTPVIVVQHLCTIF